MNHDLARTMPNNLLSLEGDIFEIRYRQQHCSHRKLIFALQEFPQDVIVTCDDDVMYDKIWLELLYKESLGYPNEIIAYNCREISYGVGGVLPYRQWPYTKERGRTSKMFLPIGCYGVLYPVDSLHPDVINQKLYLKLAPKADDLWFKAMSLLQGVAVRRASQICKYPIPIIGAKGNSLAKSNIANDGNRLQWEAICNHYKIDPRSNY